MKAKIIPIIEAGELATEVNSFYSHYNCHIDDIRTLFWEGDYMNDSYKILFFDEKAINEAEEENKTEQAFVLNFLRYTFAEAGYDSVLVDVSW